MGPFEEILHALAADEIEFIVGGGVACVLHGVERVTMYIDVSVHMHPDNLAKFLATVTRLGLKPHVPLSPEALLNPAIRRMMVEEKQAIVFSFIDPNQPIRHLDMFLRADLSYESLLPDSEWRSLGEKKVRLITKRRLLAIKRAIRPLRAKDAMDIEYLSQYE